MSRSAPIRAAALAAGLAAAALLMPWPAAAHSASDAYLTLTADPSLQGHPVMLHGQWDIALRDLDFVLKLDDNGDGRVTWGEVRKHQSAIESYAYAHLRVGGGTGIGCRLKPLRMMIDDHADGAYAALFFDALCAQPARHVTLRYSLFFTVDPSHRGIFVMNKGTDVATALLSPQNAAIDLAL